MRYWDSSAVVPLVVRQAQSDQVLGWVDEDPELAAWWGTPVECGSALARLERDGLLAPVDADRARARLGELARSWHEVQPSTDVRRRADRLVRVHGLRSLDAFQAAAALVLAADHPETLPVACFDGRLAGALRHEGFTVLGAPYG
ncbi:MAG: type II toxin-antitoxin system VapC family toxin [Acidimicrobiales bacterium]